MSDVWKELGVRFALEGSIRKAGNRVRINAQLIEAERGGHLWAERYDRELTDIFGVQDDVTRQIVDALKVTLSQAEEDRLSSGRERNVEAHDLFIRARGLLLGSNKNREMYDTVIDLCQQAIAIDPDYGAPYAAIAMAQYFDHHNHWSEEHGDALAKARQFADLAIAKDDSDAFAHFISAMVAGFEKDYERWLAETDKALALNPNFSLALNTRATFYIYSGEPMKALPLIERATRLDPANEQLFVHFQGLAYFVAGVYDTAADYFRRRIELAPTTDLTRAFLASCLGHLGAHDEARRVWDEALAINPHYRPDEHMARLPFRNPADPKRFLEGLRKAGLAGT